MFIAGVSEIEEPPVTDTWQIAGDNRKLEDLVKEDSDFFNSVDSMTYFHQRHIENFVNAILGFEPLCADGQAGRATVEVCEAVYTITKNPDLVWHSKEHISY